MFILYISNKTEDLTELFFFPCKFLVYSILSFIISQLQMAQTWQQELLYAEFLSDARYILVLHLGAAFDNQCLQNNVRKDCKVLEMSLICSSGSIRKLWHKKRPVVFSFSPFCWSPQICGSKELSI